MEPKIELVLRNNCQKRQSFWQKGEKHETNEKDNNHIKSKYNRTYGNQLLCGRYL